MIFEVQALEIFWFCITLLVAGKLLELVGIPEIITDVAVGMICGPVTFLLALIKYLRQYYTGFHTRMGALRFWNLLDLLAFHCCCSDLGWSVPLTKWNHSDVLR